MIVELLLYIDCKYCQQVFLLCRCCYRGQCYCCNECRFIAQLESRRRAQQRYRQTENGRETHREAERRRRIRKTRGIQKTVDDEGTTPPISHVTIPSKALKSIGLCHCCGIVGVIVRKFPHRGYGERRSGRYYGKQKGFNPHKSA